MESRDCLHLVWKSPTSGTQYVVGRLTRSEDYCFEYGGDCDKAKTDGWEKLVAFPESKIYHCNDLFPAFSRRLPDRKRRNIDQILKKYGLEKYDGYELLRRSGGRLPIDGYSFVEADVEARK
jgi:hypothetical protein